MNSARKLPRLNSDPSGYDKEAQYDNFNKVGHAKFRSFRRSSSPDREGGDRGRGDRGDNSMYSKYNNHRQERDYNNKYGNSRKDIRDTDRDRDRSPRDRKSWDYKEKSREKDGVDRGNTSTCNDWTEHKSSSGKKYYYNSKTEVSQWEKPREWVEAEKSRQTQMDKSRDWCEQDKVRTAPAKLHCDRNSRSSQDKHSLDGHRSSPLSSASSLAGQGVGGSGMLGRHRDRRNDRGGGSNTPSHSYQGHTPTSLHNHNSTPNNHHDTHHPNHLNFHRENSHRISESSVGEGGEDRGDATPTSEGEGEHHPAPGDQVMHPGGAVSLSAAIPRITSQPQFGLSVSTQPGPGPGSLSVRLPLGHPNSYPLPHPSPLSMYGHSSPPTPTHDSLPSPSVVSPLSSRLPQNSLGQMGSMGQLHPPIQLTPSLSRLYKEPLIGHVLGWPAEQVERGCNRISEEAHQISSHGITKVSADLKMARSLVRLAEIQATLQEQRILFLRQQMADLERVDRPNSREKSRDRESLASRDPALRDPLAARDSRDLLAARDSVTRDSNSLASSSVSRDQSMPRDVPNLARDISRDRENNLPRDQSQFANARDRLPSAETLQSQNVGNNAYSLR
eukprot:TRINITY_DN59996_c0_g1_i1.p1 TRINITY_DN59996_c0_g1~~TRINITY_DN59996_c0_g1_i1.p1  ORF type:complete len:615 (+),score=181.37 TRINITY_DN59996_c0_g1_i1:69-1913(+)